MSRRSVRESEQDETGQNGAEGMKYGRIAGNTSIDGVIYRCFELISEEDQKTFVKRFVHLQNDETQCMHTFRELILGGFLGTRGRKIMYEPSIGGRTPDWSILDDNRTECIVELANFHVDRTTEDEIRRQSQGRGLCCYWPDSKAGRLYEQIWGKASKYRRLVEQENFAYVIALFGEFTACVDLEEIQECLFDKDKGLFPIYPSVSGLLFFEENCGRYSFTYVRNPAGVREMDLPSGVF
jgi:hypothetical protein